MGLATEKDRERIIEILSSAFDRNLSVNALCLQDTKRELRIRRLMDYALKVCMAHGKVFLSDDRNSCALVLLPEKKGFSLRSLWWDLQLILGTTSITKLPELLSRQRKIKGHHPKTPIYYLWFIGVHPVHKGLGIGSELMRELISDAKAMERPIYLETSTVKNLSWYRNLGFEVYDELHLNYTLFFLRYG